jgi:hypothetical protein
VHVILHTVRYTDLVKTLDLKVSLFSFCAKQNVFSLSLFFYLEDRDSTDS